MKRSKPKRNPGRRRAPSAAEPLDAKPEDSLRERMAEGARLCAEVEAALRDAPAPELETIIKLYRVLLLKLSAEAPAVPELRHLVATLIKPVLEWARLEERRKVRELAEEVRRDAAKIKSRAKEKPGNALSPPTLEKIERELRMF